MSILPPLQVGVQTISGLVSGPFKTLSVGSINSFCSIKLRSWVLLEQEKDLNFSSHLELDLKTCLANSQFHKVVNILLNQLSA